MLIDVVASIKKRLTGGGLSTQGHGLMVLHSAVSWGHVVQLIRRKEEKFPSVVVRAMNRVRYSVL